MKACLLAICLLAVAVSYSLANTRPCPMYACLAPPCSDPIYPGGKCPSCPKCPGNNCPYIECLEPVENQCTSNQDCPTSDMCCSGCCLPRN